MDEAVSAVPCPACGPVHKPACAAAPVGVAIAVVIAEQVRVALGILGDLQGLIHSIQ
jgi:hypothetical protein